MPTTTPLSRSSARTADERDGERQQLCRPEADLCGEERRLAEVQAHLDEHRGETGQRNAFSSAPANTTATSSSTPCTSADSRSRAPAATLAPLRTITAVTGSPPSSPDDGVGGALRQQLAVGRAVPLERIEAVDRLHRQQRFDAGDDGHGGSGDPGGGVRQRRKSGLRQRRPQGAEPAERHVHEVSRGQRQRPGLRSRAARALATTDHDQRRRHHRVSAHRGVLPPVEDGQRHRGDQQRTQVKVPGDVHQPAASSRTPPAAASSTMVMPIAASIPLITAEGTSAEKRPTQHAEPGLQQAGDHHRRQEGSRPPRCCTSTSTIEVSPPPGR